MLNKKFLQKTMTLIALLSMNAVFANTIVIPMYLVAQNGKGESIGSVMVEDSICGVLIKPDLHGLPSGIHGFHIHQKPSCDNNGMAAGGHFDPQNSQEHNGPYIKQGHLGDLPALIVNDDGTSTLPTLAPKFKMKDLKGHALMIHAGGDNYSDQPEKLGGGGERIACGIIS